MATNRAGHTAGGTAERAALAHAERWSRSVVVALALLGVATLGLLFLWALSPEHDVLTAPTAPTLRDSQAPVGAQATAAPAGAAVATAEAPLRPLPGGGPPAPPFVAPDALSGNLEAYASMIVSTRGTITEIVSAHAFVLDGQVLVLSSERLPEALSRPPAPQVYRADSIEVIGAVRRFSLPAAQQALGAQLDEDKLTGWTHKPAIYATHLELRG
jgi:hypothetical protein